MGGTFTLGLIGVGTNGCVNSMVQTNTIAPNPTVSASASSPTTCINKTITLTGLGATTYSWSGGIPSTASSVTVTTGSTSGIKVFTVTGANVDGCTGTTTVSFNVNLCTGIEKFNTTSLESSVFPNPFTNELTLTGIAGRIEIYNTLGQLVVHIITKENEVIDTGTLAKGAYILKAYTGGNDVRTIKLLKN